jgi:hypothetical protein
MPRVGRLRVAMRSATSDRAARAGWLTLLLLLLGLCASGTALADDSENLKMQASARFATGAQLANEADYGAGLLIDVTFA